MEAAMIVVTTLLLNLALFSPCLSIGSMPIHHDYTRFADVERHCQSVLSSAADAELNADAGRGSRLMYQLSFMNGDWSQDAGQAPLLPFHGSYADPAVVAGPELLEAVPLASFRLTHMETVPRRRRGARAAFNVSGVLSLTIARNRSCSWLHMEMEPSPSPEFELRPGIARLHLVFQGVYTETRSSPGSGARDDGGGERVLCMVGDSVLPVRGSNSTDPWDWAKNDGAGTNLEPPVMSDGNILLVLRYPKTPTLTTRAVHGVMMSTNSKSDGAYFDTIRLVSQLSAGGYGSGYQFRQEEDAESSDVAWCSKDDSPFHEGDAMEQHHLNSGDSLGDFIHESNFNGQMMEVVPNWNCKGTDEFCSQVGPFVSRPPATSRALEDMAFTRPAIAVSMGFQSKPLGTGSMDMDGRAAATARVAAVFRYVPPWEHQPTAAKRTGMSSMTLSADGVWIPSMGRVCMVGCLGVGVAKEACHYRVSLSVGTTMSMTRRGIIAGQITAMDGESHPPLLFQQRVDPQIGGYRPLQRRMSYFYTKVEQARELLLRLRASQPAGFRNSFVARSLLSYPSIAPGVAPNDDMMVSLANLADDLDLRFQFTVKPPFVPQWIEAPFFELADTLYWHHGWTKQLSPIPDPEYAADRSTQESPCREEAAHTAECVCGVHGIQEMPRSKSGDVIGGRVQPRGWANVTVEYPPTTTRWLISQEAKVFIASTRDDDDPLHFNRTELHTLPVIYRDQRQHELTEPIVEGLLCVTMLSATIAATISQLRYIKSHADVAPYISLAMLGVQALCYSATLVTDAKMLPAWPSQRYGRPYAYHMGWNILDCSLKALTLAALAVTARLAQKVWRSRARARVRAPLEPDRVPDDTVVLLYSFGVHLGTLFFAVAVHWLSTYGTSVTTLPPRVVYYEAQGMPSSHMRTGGSVMERYVGVVKEWFLLPQVIGNAVWRINCKPLAAGYYAGVTAAWLLPRIYGYLRPPVVNMYRDTHDDVMDFYYKAGTVVIPVVGVLLAMVVYVQQRWNYKIIGWAMKTERNKLQHAY
ncbi:unnamed protein product [Miscanthus lutarioriparius]|uniref:RING-type E3 ubiquitin transferase n=1 Tax=Miscanthus lutarioriparius TaxID=422564 RepID=A0A811Q260_9POAL|nr:unnamed protein product [Miscanthus lutarioriparius]